MMFRYLPVVFSALAVTSSALGAESLGTITAAGPFELRGMQVPASAGRSLPLLNGDRIETGDSSAVILFWDSSRVAVREHTQVKVERSNESTVLCLDQGGIAFRVAEGSRLVICAGGRRILPRPGSEGTIVFEGPDKVQANSADHSIFEVEDEDCKCGRRSRKPLVVIGVGAGAATAFGLAVTGGEDPLPPISGSEP